VKPSHHLCNSHGLPGLQAVDVKKSVTFDLPVDNGLNFDTELIQKENSHRAHTGP
jgi:hypothetical protein